MSNGLDSDQARRSVGPDISPNCLQRLSGPDLGPNCLQMLSADDTSMQRVDSLSL